MHESVLRIGLSSWIIQDGNYGDFECETTERFALEFYSESGLSNVDSRIHYLAHEDDARYRAAGIVRFCGPDAWVVDFDGVLAFREGHPPDGIRPGVTVAGELCLGVDPFFYFERLAKLPNIPPLIYEWRIDAIAMQTAPFVEEADSAGRTMLVRDPSKLRRMPIKRTDAWNDDHGTADYLLTCRRTIAAPTKSRG